MTAVERLGRAYDLYRRTARSRTAVLLVLANLVPLIGVMFFGWSLHTILVLYWLENGIVGAWNVPRILLARGLVLPLLPGLPDTAALGAPLAAGAMSAIPRAAFALFFAFHYGMFWLVHGVFVFVLPVFAGDVTGSPTCLELPGTPPCPGDASGPFGAIVWPAVVIGAIALLLSHGASFFFNYLGRGEFRTASPPSRMFAPYARVVVLHLTIILGAFVIVFLGAPIGALLVLVVLKTAFDLLLHLREHRYPGPPLRNGAAPA